MIALTVRALIIEDDPDHADLLEISLGRLPGFEFRCTKCRSSAEAGSEVHQQTYDVVFADYWLGADTCKTFLEEHRQRGGTTAVVVTTSANDEYVAASVTRAGACAYLRKDDLDGPLLLQAVRDAMQQSERNRRRTDLRSDAARRLDGLTPRERQIADLIADGLQTKHIASQLGCADGTVSIHRSHILAKTKARSVADLVRLVITAAGARDPVPAG